MSETIHGIHHVTAIGGEPVTNLDFYTRVLGLRLVKRTVNFDDPTTWHLYFGDEHGSPGTLMTFFPHPLARAGRAGSGEVARTTFAVPAGALADWRQRLEREGLALEQTDEGDQHLLEVRDPHGTRLALTESAGPSHVEPWTGGQVSADLAIRSIESVRLDVPDVDATVAFLQEMFGLQQVGGRGDRRWLDAGGGQRVEVKASARPRAQLGAGSVHHVAFRVPDDEAHVAMQRRLAEGGYAVTEVKDRQYFRSIYFREPGGVIFEIATDVPGFATDEPEAELGQRLKLPPWLESRRTELMQSLPPLTQEVSS
ncbi:ring-cleaving dioxygenase [Phycisphaerales bacterium AB-hyl4]|uniref:Ring-cleaving dioxygenase n=1 Tax=Natronomicrosphaera hydrolytica TaxID=3242702 RepID=A0ABV4U824_9BACT